MRVGVGVLGTTELLKVGLLRCVSSDVIIITVVIIRRFAGNNGPAILVKLSIQWDEPPRLPGRGLGASLR